MGDDSTSSSAERIATTLAARLSDLPAGSRVASTRSLAAEFGAGPVTVQQAMRILQARGRIEIRPGAGTFVLSGRSRRPVDRTWQTATLPSGIGTADTTPAALADPPADAMAFHAGYPSVELLPERLVRAALTRAARGRSAMVRSSTLGDIGLREWFAAELRDATPAEANPPSGRDVLITPGSQAALHAIFRAVGAGLPVVVESPTYWGALMVLGTVGAQVVPIPSGPSGPDPDVLDRALASSGARAFYAQPNFANPTGATWSALTRARVLDVVRRRSAFLVEDDWAHDFGIDEPSVPVAASDDAGHVIYVRSLTKSVSPSIRVAAVIARGPIRDRILAGLTAEAMYVSPFLQAAALDVVTNPGWTTHRKTLSRLLRLRRDELVASLRNAAPDLHITAVPRGGLNLWLQLPEGIPAPAVEAACRSSGLLLSDGAAWFPAEAPGEYLRLNFGDAPPDRYREAAAIIQGAIATVERTQ